jgi:O-acetyl-ADP-ribose deacetylase (regulator of RNase III)
MPFEIIREDITRLITDAIVHPTNPNLKMGRGSSEAIFRLAGINELTNECKTIGFCAPGDVVVTPGFNLPAKYIVHTVGPLWNGGIENESLILESCYRKSLECALLHNFKSIAFPLISSGHYGYPKEEALRIAIHTIQTFLFNHEMMVYLVVYDKLSYQISSKLFVSIKTYIDDNYVEKSIQSIRIYDNKEDRLLNRSYDKVESNTLYSLTELFTQLDKSFSESLLSLIDQKNLSDVEVYKRANISKAHFSKIRSHVDYRPTKSTVLAFCVALRLSLNECINLLEKAGFSLSNSSKHDLIIRYFIEQNNYDIYEINKVLFEYDQTLLGSNTL